MFFFTTKWETNKRRDELHLAIFNADVIKLYLSCFIASTHMFLLIRLDKHEHMILWSKIDSLEKPICIANLTLWRLRVLTRGTQQLKSNSKTSTIIYHFSICHIFKSYWGTKFKIQRNLVMTSSVVNEHSVITKRFLNKIGYFSTEINLVITNPEQKLPIPGCLL
jgi:hypothetical protein